ncbi:DNA cytosine methyltransferase [Lactobacillus amylovorus]|jgi:DNA (cytosine-5)-methyltransferase 1|uniref:DNA cytosine methyltransferase n=1 Tax=Lactobacillus amylovorus TaxID=1604 RepID=UPI00232FD75A|nr:DNA (cytosine-5-)-methyltransferase [Lactobacillus amylovorus]MDB6225936.1 DNA cytosine methyltransferase [Lactobacillus amylovorus]
MVKRDKQFVSSLSMSEDEVSSILDKKIFEEKEKAKKNQTVESQKFEQKLFANTKYDPNKINILSLFSGAGGLDLGTELSAINNFFGKREFEESYRNKDIFHKYANEIINVVYSNDNFRAANLSYKNNLIANGVQDTRDVRKVTHFPKSDLMLGGFPCPGFSAAGPRLLDDPRNFLYIHYIRALMDSEPLVFIAENVKGLMTMAHGQVLKQIKEDFAAAGYFVTAQLLNAKNYSVPQSRERVFIIGVRNDLHKEYQYEYPLPITGTLQAPLVTLKEAIGDLPKNPKDVFDSDYSSIYMSRNRKKSWNDVSFTIQASGRQAPQYPGGEPMKKVSKDKWVFQGNLNRRLSVRECARIQTFPDWFVFSDGNKGNVKENNKLNEQYKQIGNAVPVLLAKSVTSPVLKYLIHKLGISKNIKKDE